LIEPLVTIRKYSGETAIDLAKPLLAQAMHDWHNERSFILNQLVVEQSSNTLFNRVYRAGLFNHTAPNLSDCEITCQLEQTTTLSSTM